MIRHFVSKSPLSLSNQQRTSLGVLLHTTTTTTTSTTINHHHHHHYQQQQQQQERSFHSLSTSHSFHQSPVSLHQYTTKNNHNNKSNNKNNNQNVSNNRINNSNDNNNNNNNNAASGGKSKKAMNTKASLAQRLFEEKKWNESIDLFNQVLSVDPDHPVALVGRAKIHTLMGRYSEALIDSQKAHSVDTSFALLNDMFVIHAGLLLRLAKYDDLLFYGNQMSDHAKKAQHPYFLASCLRFMAIAVIKRLMQKGDYASALDFIDQRVLAGLDNFNEVHELFHLKSQLLLRMDKFDEAAEVAQRYLKHDQNEGTECPVTTFYHIYAQTSHYQGEKALAKEILGLWGQMIEEDCATQSFEYQCFRVEYQYTKAKIYAMQGHISSLDMYKTVLNNAKQEQHLDFIPDILVDMALAKNLFGLKDEAKKDLQEALTYVPAHAVYSQINL